MPVTVLTYSFLCKRNARKGKQMLAKNTLHLEYSPAFKAVEAFNEAIKRRGPWKLKAFWKYLGLPSLSHETEGDCFLTDFFAFLPTVLGYKATTTFAFLLPCFKNYLFCGG